MNGTTRHRLQQLDRRLKELYRHTAEIGMLRHRRALQRALDEDTSEYERERIFREVSRAIAQEAEIISEAAGEAIEKEAFNLFAKNFYIAAGVLALPRPHIGRKELRLLYTTHVTFPGTPLPRSIPKGSITGAMSQLAADRALSERYFQRALARLGQSNNMTAQIMSDFREAHSRGEGVHKMARRIQKATNTERYKALRIAQTECLRASNQGSYAAACKAIDEHGFIMTKTWHAALDERTRDIHEEANGQTVDFYEPFIVGGEPLQYPLDPNASPENVINCRCSASYRVVGFSSLTGE